MWVNLHWSVPNHLSLVPYVICVTLGTARAGVLWRAGKATSLVCRECNIQEQWNGMFSLFWKQKECLIHCNFLHTYLHTLAILLALSVCGGDFSGVKLGPCYGFFITMKNFFFFPVAVLRLDYFLQSIQCSCLFPSQNFSMFFILLFCVTALLISNLWLVHQHFF